MPVSKRRAVGVVAEGRALYGRHVLGERLADVRHAEVRAAELVRRAEHDVRVDRLHVHRLVRGVVHRVDPGERADAVCQLAHALRVDDGADRVRGPGERDDLRPLAQLRLEIREVERRVGVDVDVRDDEPEVVGELDPGGHVAVMVEARDEDLVAGLQLAAEHARQVEVDGRHVRAEDDLRGAAVEEARAGGLGVVDDLVDAMAGRVGRSEIRARVAQGVRDRLSDLVRHLRAAGGVEEGEARLER